MIKEQIKHSGTILPWLLVSFMYFLFVDSDAPASALFYNGKSVLAFPIRNEKYAPCRVQLLEDPFMTQAVSSWKIHCYRQ